MIPLLYFLIILFFTSCKTIQPPIWVKEFGVRTFSKDGIEGIGFVKFDKKDKSSLPLARQAAYNEAIKNLAVKLKTEVKGEIEHKMSDKITYVGKKFKQEAQDQINSLTDVLFNAVLGRKYFEEYIDYKNSLYWVYVWTTKAELNRAITEELEKQEMKNLAIMKTCIQQFKSAEEQIYRGNLILGLKLFSQILKNLSEVKGLSVVEKVDNISLEIDTRNKIDRIVSSFHITPIGRTNIETLRNTNIEIELNVECKYNYGDKTIVASGFPLKLNFIKGTGDGEKVKFTDNNGIAKFKLYQIDTEENIIEILPDIDSLPQEIPQLSDFSKVKAIYNIIARSQRTIKKMLIKILSEKDIYLSNFFKNEFVSQLKQVGFNITDTLPADYCLEVDIATEYLGDKITLPDGTQKSFAEQFSGSVNIKLKDMNTNNILLSKSFVGIKGFGRTKKEAEEVTLKKMAGIVAEYVDKNFSK